MFGKVIVFGLFEMIKNKIKRVRTASLGPGLASGLGLVRRREPSQKAYKKTKLWTL